MKSKRQIEKELWPLVRLASNISDQDGHAEYVKFQREFQKRVSEELKHNPISVEDLVLRVDVTAKDISALLKMNFSLRKKPQNR